jgi:hypothetical protein
LGSLAVVLTARVAQISTAVSCCGRACIPLLTNHLFFTKRLRPLLCSAHWHLMNKLRNATFLEVSSCQQLADVIVCIPFPTENRKWKGKEKFKENNFQKKNARCRERVILVLR